MSTRQKIEDALKASLNITLSELQIQLPDIKPATLKTEFYRIKRKLTGPVTEKKPKLMTAVAERISSIHKHGQGMPEIRNWKWKG